MSRPATGKNIPEIPPIVKVTKKPSDQSVCVLKTNEPPQSVANQLKIFTPVGIATNIVVNIITSLKVGSIPLVSM